MGVSLKSYNFEDLLEREDGWVPKHPLYDVQFWILDDSGEKYRCKLKIRSVSPSSYLGLFASKVQPSVFY